MRWRDLKIDIGSLICAVQEQVMKKNNFMKCRIENTTGSDEYRICAEKVDAVLNIVS